MMGVLVMVFWVLGGATVQALAPTWNHLGNPAFPVLPGVVLYAATHKSARDFVWVALSAGVLEDALSLAPFGCSSLAFMAAGGLAMTLREDFQPGNTGVAMVLGGLCMAVSTGVMAGLLKFKGLTALGAGAIGTRMAGSALLGAVLVPLLFALMRGMERRLGTLEERL